MPVECDDRWGYVVTAAAFLIHFVTCGICYSCGAIYYALLEEFDRSHFMTSSPGSVMLGMTAIAGIPASALVYKFGCRVPVIYGGLVTAVGFIIASFASELWHVTTALGVVAGAGMGFTMVPSVMIINEHFEKHPEVAVSIAICGSSIGVVFFPVLIQHLIVNYGWQVMLRSLAGICGIIVLAGITFRPGNGSLKSTNRDLIKIFEPVLLKSGIFIVLLASNFLWSIGISIIYTELPGYCKSTGLTIDEGMVLVAISGLASFVSRSLFLVFHHSAKLDHMSIFVCTVGVSAVLTGLFPDLFHNKAGQIGYAMILGLHTGFWGTFMDHVGCEVIGRVYMAYGRGFLCLSIGLGLMCGAPIAGWVYDMNEDYEINFYTAGSCLLFSSVIMVIVNMKGCYLRLTHELLGSDWDNESSKSMTSPLVLQDVVVDDRTTSV